MSSAVATAGTGPGVIIFHFVAAVGEIAARHRNRIAGSGSGKQKSCWAARCRTLAGFYLRPFVLRADSGHATVVERSSELAMHRPDCLTVDRTGITLFRSGIMHAAGTGGTDVLRAVIIIVARGVDGSMRAAGRRIAAVYGAGETVIAVAGRSRLADSPFAEIPA